MSDLTIRTLMLAISALAGERSALLKRIQACSMDEINDEHLSEQVLDIDQALGELADEYDTLRGDSQTYPTYEKLTGLDQ